MALVNLGTDPWLSEYESCDKLQREIMEQLSLRSKELKTSEKYIQLSAAIRLRLKQFNNELDQLKIKLEQESKSRSITSEEAERRSRQVEILQSKNVQMKKLFENNIGARSAAVDNNRDRERLMGRSARVHAVQDLGTADWGVDDGENSQLVHDSIQDQSIESIRHQQRQIAEGQERGLEELSNIISRQKQIAQTINDEVDIHNEIIDDLGEHINRTDLRVVNETHQVQVVDRKDRTCGYWVVIILLFISIIVVVVV